MQYSRPDPMATGQPSERDEHGHTILIAPVLLAEFDHQFAFLQESSHDQISREDEVDRDRSPIQITRPEENEDRDIPGMPHQAQHSRVIKIAAGGHRTAGRVLADLLNSEELEHAVVSGAGHDK